MKAVSDGPDVPNRCVLHQNGPDVHRMVMAGMVSKVSGRTPRKHMVKQRVALVVGQ